jgi:integrase
MLPIFGRHRLGHKRVEVTLGIYAHVLPAMQEDAASKLAALGSVL